MESIFLRVPNDIGFELIELANISQYGPTSTDVHNLYTSRIDRYYDIIKRTFKDSNGDTLIESYRRGQIQSSKLVNINGEIVDEVSYTYNDDSIEIIESKHQRTFFKYHDGRCVGYRVFDIEPSGSATISETCSIEYKGPLDKISCIRRSDKYGKESKIDYYYTDTKGGILLSRIVTKYYNTILYYDGANHTCTTRIYNNGDRLDVYIKNDTPFVRPLFRKFYYNGVFVGFDKFRYAPNADIVTKYTDNFQKGCQKKYFYYDKYCSLVEIRRYTNGQQSTETELMIEYEYEEGKKNENDKR